MRIFEEILFFKATYNSKTNKQITYSFAGLILAEREGHETDVRSDLFNCVCIVRSFEKENFLEKSHPALFCLIKKRSL